MVDSRRHCFWGLITARQAAKQTTELQPDNGEYAALLAYVCHQQGDYDAAARILDGLIKNRPSDPLATRLRERIRQDMARANDATGGDAGRPH